MTEQNLRTIGGRRLSRIAEALGAKQKVGIPDMEEIAGARRSAEEVHVQSAQVAKEEHMPFYERQLVRQDSPREEAGTWLSYDAFLEKLGLAYRGVGTVSILVNGSYANVSYMALEIEILKLRREHPDWFMTGLYESYRSMSFSLEAVEALKERFSHIEVAPEGWRPIGAVATMLHSSTQTIRDRIDDALRDHPESFGAYKRPRGVILTYYSPEFVEWLRTKLPKESERFEKDFETIKEIIKGMPDSDLDRLSSFVRIQIAFERSERNRSMKRP